MEGPKISATSQNIRFSGPVNSIHQRRLPETASPAGYSALIDAYALQVPIPMRLAASGERHRVTDTPDWLIMTPRHKPQASLRGFPNSARSHRG